ncbi:diguanylate cyclase [Aurantimonas sp. A2-1-M11]|uniref:GGDEF domain-containing protein n=1 Tax=Aurantimonas sp. A2-1-M11 TaxID=3113712 RepID=UPI002F9400B7
MRETQAVRGLAVAVIDALTSHICVLNKHGTIIAVNRAWREFAVANSYLKERSGVGANYLTVCQSVVGQEAKDALAFHDGIRSVLQSRQDYFQLEYPCHSPAEERWFLARVSPLYRGRTEAASRGPSGAVVSHANITDRKSLEIKLAHIAATDYLTGLSNRRAFVEDTEAALVDLRRTARKASLLTFDVDRFKSINDTHGHQSGDDALRAIATTCRSVLRSADLVARIGGEEFACFMPDIDAPDASLIAERLRHSIAALDVVSHPQSFKITVSIGVASMPPGGATLDQMLVSADRAMYRAKREGRNCVRVQEVVERVNVAEM